VYDGPARTVPSGGLLHVLAQEVVLVDGDKLVFPPPTGVHGATALTVFFKLTGFVAVQPIAISGRKQQRVCSDGCTYMWSARGRINISVSQPLGHTSYVTLWRLGHTSCVTVWQWVTHHV